MGLKAKRNLTHCNMTCRFPRFLQIVINNVLPLIELVSFISSPQSPSSILTVNVVTALINHYDYPSMQVIELTNYMQDCPFQIAFPALPHQGLPQ